MSFQNLNKDELKEVADFFVVNVDSAKEGEPTKNELVAALVGDEVTWDQYNDIFLKAKADGEDKSEEAEGAVDLTSVTEPVVEDEVEEDTSNHVLIKYDRNNPSYQIIGYTFTRQHPFASVPPEKAEYLVRNVPGFRLALPSEVTDYYN